MSEMKLPRPYDPIQFPRCWSICGRDGNFVSRPSDGKRKVWRTKALAEKWIRKQMRREKKIEGGSHG